MNKKNNRNKFKIINSKIIYLNNKKFIIRGLNIYYIYNNIYIYNEIKRFLKYINTLKILITLKEHKIFIFIRNIIYICIKNNIILIIEIKIKKLNFIKIKKYLILLKKIKQYNIEIIINFNNFIVKNFIKWIFFYKKLLFFIRINKIYNLILINYPINFYKINFLIRNKIKKFFYLKKNIILYITYKYKNLLELINIFIKLKIPLLIKDIKYNKNIQNIINFCHKKEIGWITKILYKKKINKNKLTIINCINGIRQTSIKK